MAWPQVAQPWKRNSLYGFKTVDWKSCKEWTEEESKAGKAVEKGKEEAKVIENYLKSLIGLSIIKVQNFKDNSPYFIGIEKD